MHPPLDTDRFARRWARTQATVRHGLQTFSTDVAWRTRQLSQAVSERSAKLARHRPPPEWIPQVRIERSARSQGKMPSGSGGRAHLETVTASGVSSTRAESSTRAAESRTDSTADIEMQVGMGKGRRWEAPKEARRRPLGDAVRLLLRTLDIGVNLASVSIQAKYLDSMTYDITGISLERFYSLPLLLCMAWEIAEIVTQCARRGRGITPKAHIGVELTICLFLSTMLGLVVWAYIDMEINNNWFYHEYRVHVTFLSLLAAASFTHLYLFLSACIARHREIKGRRAQLMYVPGTGQIIYVVVKPQDSTEMPVPPSGKATPSRGRISPPPLSPQPRSIQRTPPVSPTPGPPPSRAPAAAAAAVHSPKPSDTNIALAIPPLAPTETEVSTPLSQTSTMNIQRKPLPPRPIPVQSLHPPMRPGHEPPGPDYVPDETELERRARGDAQPQMMSPHDLDLKFSASNTGMTPAPSHKRETKVLLDGVRLHRSNSF